MSPQSKQQDKHATYLDAVRLAPQLSDHSSEGLRVHTVLTQCHQYLHCLAVKPHVEDLADLIHNCTKKSG